MFKTAKLFAATLIGAVCLSSAVLAKDDPAEDAAMKAYTLSMAKVKAFDAAYKTLTAAMKTDPALKKEYDAASDEPDQTLAQIRAKVQHHPHVFGYFARRGLSTDDTVLLPLVLVAGVTAAQSPQAAAGMGDMVSANQIAFCKQHMAELQNLSFMQGDDPDE